MKTFREWAENNTLLYEMALFKSAEGQGTWKLANIEIQGPDVYSLLSKHKDGMAIADLAHGLLDGAKFRKLGSNEAFKSLDVVAKEQNKDTGKVKAYLMDLLKDQLRKQKAVGKWRVIIANNKWSLAPDADKAGTSQSKAKEEKESLFDEPKAEEKKEERKPRKRTEKKEPAKSEDEGKEKEKAE